MMIVMNEAPCPEDEQWFWVEDIQLLSAYTGHQRIYVSLK